MATDDSALETVLMSDVKRTELLKECKELEKAQEKGKDVTEKLNDVSEIWKLTVCCDMWSGDLHAIKRPCHEYVLEIWSGNLHAFIYNAKGNLWPIPAPEKVTPSR